MTFDILYLDRCALTGLPLRDRRARLEDVVVGSELVFPVRRLAPNGLEGWTQVIEREYERFVPRMSGADMRPAQHGIGSK